MALSNKELVEKLSDIAKGLEFNTRWLIFELIHRFERQLEGLDNFE